MICNVASIQVCDSGQWSCVDNKKCINEHSVCDGLIHCRDGSDEKKEMCALWNCTNNKIKCNNETKCTIEAAKVCNAFYDCKDKSDEDITLCRTWQCPTRHWKCANGACINYNNVCDGYPHCLDGSDELTCENWICPEGHWKCADQTRFLEMC